MSGLGPLTAAQKLYKRRIMSLLATHIDDFVELNAIDASELSGDEQDQVVDELGSEFFRRSIGHWRHTVRRAVDAPTRPGS